MTVTRFAPSPTGRLHLGHAFSAVLGHERARRGGGKFLLRIEDLDVTRSRREFVAAIIEDLGWLGLEWDEPVLVQSQRAGAYANALERLQQQGLVYPCFCTRSDIAAALQAPHGASAHYPGTCRGLADDPERRASTPHSWRLDATRRSQPRVSRRGLKRMAAASPRQATTSTTRSWLARTRRPLIISPASSTMLQAA